MAKWRKRAFAWCYHHLLSRQGEPDFSDPFTREVRAPLLAQARGDVLEIGAGTGGNLPFYPPGVRLTLLEPNPYMIRYLDGNCTAHAADCAAIVEGIGERLPFPANSFDTVLTTHVLCSVRDQSEVLAEVRRSCGTQFAPAIVERAWPVIEQTVRSWSGERDQMPEAAGSYHPKRSYA
ncbi:MAG: class I SAM-dependent methyltransferase [Symbiobacteriaceae bacterium]